MARPAVFLDRDGTLVEECGYLVRLDDLRLFPWTTDALRLLKRAGFTTVVVTNQAAVGRGLVDEAFVHAVHVEIDRRVEPAGAVIDRYYFCPHSVESTIDRYRQRCRCRKPGPGLIEQACRDLDLDAADSFMVGDRWRDVECGRAAGMRGVVLLRSGPHAHEVATPPDGVRADAILNNLMEAVGWILRTSLPS